MTHNSEKLQKIVIGMATSHDVLRFRGQGRLQLCSKNTRITVKLKCRYIVAEN